MQRAEFQLLRKIGEGGMAEVFLAERAGDENFKTLVALKRLHAGFALDQYFIRQLVAEARLLGQLQHNNIVRVHDLRRIDDEYFIVMEYIDGIDLAQAIAVHRDRDIRIPLAIFFHIALSLCEALEFAHSATDLEGRPIRLIHRDIKPSNVLLSARGIVKLTDFGIARVGDTSNTGSVVKGTANYMSPEQAAGEHNLTPASDIFSLGAVLWEMLTLEKLVDGNNYLNVIHAIKELNVGLKDITKKGIEPSLRMILLRLLARKRELRYQNMGLVLKDLRFVAEQMKVDLSPSHVRDYIARTIAMAKENALRAQPNLAQSEGGPSGAAVAAAGVGALAVAAPAAVVAAPAAVGAQPDVPASPASQRGPAAPGPLPAGSPAVGKSGDNRDALGRGGHGAAPIQAQAAPAQLPPQPHPGHPQASQGQAPAAWTGQASAQPVFPPDAGAAGSIRAQGPPLQAGSPAARSSAGPSGQPAGPGPMGAPAAPPPAPSQEAADPQFADSVARLRAVAEQGAAVPGPIPRAQDSTGRWPRSPQGSPIPPIGDANAAGSRQMQAPAGGPAGASSAAAGAPAAPRAAPAAPPVPASTPAPAAVAPTPAAAWSPTPATEPRRAAPPHASAQAQVQPTADQMAPPSSPALRPVLARVDAVPAAPADASNRGSSPVAAGGPPHSDQGAPVGLPPRPVVRRNVGTAEALQAVEAARSRSIAAAAKESLPAAPERPDPTHGPVAAASPPPAAAPARPPAPDPTHASTTPGEPRPTAPVHGAPHTTAPPVAMAPAPSVASAPGEGMPTGSAPSSRPAPSSAALAAVSFGAAAANAQGSANSAPGLRPQAQAQAQAPKVPARPQPPVPPTPEGPQPILLDDDGDDDDDEDDDRANRRVLIIGGSLGAILLALIVLLATRPPADPDAGLDAPLPPVEIVEGDARGAPAEPTPAPTPEPPSEPTPEPVAAVEPQPGPTPSPVVDPRPRTTPEPTASTTVSRTRPSQDSWTSRPGPASNSASSRSTPPSSTASRTEPTPRPEPAPRSSTGSQTASTATSGSSSSGVLEAGGLDLPALAERARRAQLDDSDLRRLRAIAAGGADWKESRAILLAHYDAAANVQGHCDIANEAMRAREAAADPQFQLEMSKCHLREGRYQDALKVARAAEQHAEDIPSRIRTDRQLKIWEVQAKAHKGLYQGSENLDFLRDAISVWKRYQNLATNTYRQRDAERAEKEIQALERLSKEAL